MLNKVTIRTRGGGAIPLPLEQEGIDGLLEIICSSADGEEVNGLAYSRIMFDVNTLVKKEDVNSQVWVRLSDIECIIVEPMSNIAVPQKGILTPEN